ncbi:MAG: aminotransferase class I/II-fold pyridoxal phosphate-dependent enzyme [bacterium]
MLQVKEKIPDMSFEQKRALVKQLLQNKVRGEIKTDQGYDTGKDIPPEYTDFEHFPQYRAIKKQSENMKQLEIRNPYFDCHSDVSNDTVLIDDKDYINYSGYNYLGFSGDPEINEATKKTIDQYGTSVSASRIVSGEIVIHKELEKEIASLIGTDDCVVAVSGYATNTSTIGYLFGPKDVIFHDSLSHNSIMIGCKLSGARRIPFPHNNFKALEALMEENRYYYQKALIVIEGVYSMDGDISRLNEFIELKKRYKAFLMVDEAHSMGTIGKNGFGIREYCNVDPYDVDIWMGTLSKSFASCGGYIAGKKALIENLKYNAPGCIMYSAGITPTNAAAALASVRKLKREPEHVERLRSNFEYFLYIAQQHNLDTGLSKDSPIIPIIIRNSISSLRIANRLFENGINVHPILYPAVPEDEARLRFFITAKHTKEQIKYTIETISNELKNI